MSRGDDFIPKAYPYEWSKSSGISLPDFLTKYKPSMVQDDGTKPWIWVIRTRHSGNLENEEAATEESTALLKEVSKKVEAIKNDASIPMRSNKKTGAKSKKEVREQIQTEAAEKLKKISQKHGYVCGKWLIFAPSDKVDTIWSRLSTSLISGPLASTSAFTAKVSTCPRDGTAPAQHLICLYMPDIYDKDAITEVMKILLRNHGFNLTGVKSDLYTAIGLDSKHPSGIPSTTWKNTALMTDSEIKKLRDEFYANPAPEQSAPTKKSDEPVETKAPVAAAPSKPKLKKKINAADDDPFASDVDDDDDDDAAKEEEKRKKLLKNKTVSAKKATPKSSDAEDEDNEGKRPRKRKKA